MHNQKRKTLSAFALFLILFVALYFRLVNLGKNPAGFFCDEASIGYNAYTLLTSGKDEYGFRWPLFFRAFGEYKSPVMTYSTIPFIYLFGLNEFSVRLVSAVYGVLAVVAVYFLGKRLGGNFFGIVSALLLAISPWHVHFSRVSLEGLMPFTFFTTLATYFWPITEFDRKKLLTSLILFVLAIYSYFPARVFVPLYCLLLSLLSLRLVVNHWRTYLLHLFLTFILALPLIIHTLIGPGLSRWNQVRPDNFQSKKIVRLYLAHFDYQFLFYKGDSGYPGQFITRHSVRGVGEMYLFQLPLLVLSGLWFYRSYRKGNRPILVLFFWLLLYPVGTVLTDATSPQATRSIIGSVVFQLLSAGGVCFIVSGVGCLSGRWLKNGIRVGLGIVAIIIVIWSSWEYSRLLEGYPRYSSDFWGWQYGAGPVMSYFLTNQADYDLMCLEGAFNAADVFIRFYDPTNRCQGKCRICGLEARDKTGKTRELFAVTPNTILDSPQLSSGYVTKQLIAYPNGETAFLIGDLNNNQ